MKRKKVVRNVTLATVATGLVQLTGAGTAGAGPESPAALCTSTFGEQGPAGGPIVGEGPPGDAMTVTLGWDVGDWPEGLREVVTCLSIDGRAFPGMTRLTAQPPNAGNIAVDLLLPPGPAGSLVCQNSILVGTASTEGRRRQTGPVCFKLRAAEELLAGPEAPQGPASPSTGTPSAPTRATPAAPDALAAPAPKPAPAHQPGSTPPARAAFEAARGAARAPAAWRTGSSHSSAAWSTAPAPARSAPAPEAKPTAPVTRAGQAADELARTPDGPSLSAAATATATTAPRKGAVAQGAASRAGATAAPGIRGAADARAALPRTGVGDKIPLAGAGTLMALGGAAIILGEPRRRAVRRPA